MLRRAGAAVKGRPVELLAELLGNGWRGELSTSTVLNFRAVFMRRHDALARGELGCQRHTALNRVAMHAELLADLLDDSRQRGDSAL